MKKKLLLVASPIIVLSLLVVVINSNSVDGNAYAKQSQDDHKQKDKLRYRTPQSGEEWFDLAYEFHNADRYPEAIEAFKKAVELDYRKATAMYNVACGYAMLNDSDNALLWLQQAIDNEFSGTSRLFDDSDLDSLRGNPKFRELLKQVSARTRRDRLDETLQEFDRLQQTSSQDGADWYRVGKRFLRLRDIDRAIVALTQAVNLLGYQNDSAMYKLGSAFALNGNRDLALDWLEKAVDAGYDNILDKDPDLKSLSSESRFKSIEEKSRILSLTQFFKDNDSSSPGSERIWASAAAFYESYLQRQPGSGRGWFNLGYSLHYASEHQKAIAAFDRALALGYRKPTSMYNLACANAMLGNRDVALGWLKKSYDAGFEINGYLDSDKDLNSVRNDPRFEELRDRVYAEKREFKWRKK